MADAEQRLTSGGVDQFVLLGVDGSPVGSVDGTAWASVPTGMRARTSLAAVAVPLPPEAVLRDVHSGSALAQGAAAAAEQSAMLVLIDTAAPGEVRGIVRVRDVISALHPKP